MNRTETLAIIQKLLTNWTLLAMLAAAGAGCAPAVSAPPAQPTTRPQNSSPSASADRPVAPPLNLAKLAGQEVWDVYYLGGARLGYGFTRWQAVPGSPDLIAAEGLLHLSVKRFGETTVSEAKMSVVETVAGDVREFNSETRMGPTPSTAAGRVAGGKMFVTQDSAGQKSESGLPWPDGTAGYFAVDETLRSRPLKSGESRTISALMPIFNQVASVELRARESESVTLLEGARELLRIETTTKLPGAQPIDGVLWTDETGNVLKLVMTALDQTVYRTTKEIALRESGLQVLDLGTNSLVKTPRPLVDPHQAKRILYRIHLNDADPAKTFVSDQSQQVKPLDLHTAEVVVKAIRPDDPAMPDPPGGTVAGPKEDDRRPNRFIQSEDPRILKMARDASGKETGPWRKAVALEKYVHDQVAEKNYSQTFASAAEVAQSLEGDCTEHAVLLAALLRSSGIPSRVAVGLVYVPGSQAFAFHMWTEAFVADRWIGLDGTLGQGGIGAGHLKLATTNLSESAGLASFLPVAQVLGKMKIESVQQ